MANPVTSSLDTSDTSLAYAIFRLTFGVNICFRGVARIFVLGLDNFAAGMTKQFSATAFPPAFIDIFAHTLPWIETVIGLMLILGLGTRYALIIVACYVFRYSPTGIRATVALLQQIDRSIEEAPASLGARTAQTFRRVTLPLIAPAFFAGLGVVFIRSMTAISATIFLVSLSWTLITVRILENMTELALGPAAAFSVFVIVVVFVVTAALGLQIQEGGRGRQERGRIHHRGHRGMRRTSSVRLCVPLW